MTKPRVFVHLDHGRSSDTWARMYDADRVSEPFPYSYDLALPWVELRTSEDHAEARLVRFARRASSYLLGFDLLHAWRNRAGVRTADVVWTHTEHEHLALSALMRLRVIPRRPMIAQSIWMWDAWDTWSSLRRRWHRCLLGPDDLHTTHSPSNLEVARRVVPGRSCLVPFGVTVVEPVPVPDPSPRIRVVAPGNDRDRDWALLREVASRCPDIEVQVLSRRRAARGRRSSRPVNYRVDVAPTVARLRGEVARADVVVVPLRANGHVSGMTTILEGLAMTRPVVATDTGGLSELVHGLVTFAGPGSATDLERAIREAAAQDPGTSRWARDQVTARGLTLTDYARRHVLLTRVLLDPAAELTEEVSRLGTISLDSDS